MESNFQNRVCRRSMQAVVDAIHNMNLDMIEGVTGLVPFSMMLRAKELAREIQHEINRLPPVEAEEQTTECKAASLPPITDEDWSDYEDFHSTI